MKKLLSIILSITLVVGLAVGVNSIKTSADITINSTPTAGSEVSLLSGRVGNFCANYAPGAVDTYYKKYGNDFYPTPMRVDWDSVSGATSYKVEVGTSADLSDATTYNVSTNQIDVEDLYAGKDYDYRVSTEVSGQNYSTGIISIKTVNYPRTVRISGIQNTRDFGGSYTVDGWHRVKQGVIYRGARLDEISDTAKNKMLNTYGIKTDFDLREKEKAPTSSPLGDSVKFINISSPQYLDKPDYTKSGVGYGISNPDNFETLKNEFLVFADASNYPMYLHCNIGRDRTGTVCSLLGGLIGMSESDIYRDYELSFFDNWCNGNLGSATPSEWEVKRIGIMLDYIKDYYQGATLQEKITAYMKQSLGITDDQISAIKNNLLDVTGTPPTSEVKPTIKPKTTTKAVVKKPGKAKILKAKYKKKRKIYIKLKKITGAKGYHIRYSDSKKFDGYWDKYTKKKTITLKKLERHTKYYIKARAYKKANGKKLYGKWSKVKKVKVKK